jgi:SAP domain
MGWLDRWLGRKPPSSLQESIYEAQLVPANWASSQPHLALLKRFLSAREAKDAVPDFWAPALGKSPKHVIDEMVAHGALEPLPLLETIEICYTVAELKKILSSRGLRVSGKKAELVQRLLEADPKGMEKLCAHRMVLRCTPAASQAVSRWEAEQSTAFETATDNVIAALRNRHFKAAICTADAYRKSKFVPPVHPAQEAMTIHPAPRSIEERANDLATVFTMRPKILKGLQPEQWEGLYLNYAVWQLLGRVAPDKCMPGFTGIGAIGNGAMSSETATRMLSFHVGHQRDLARWRELGITSGTIIGIGGCEACLALYNKTFRLDKLPELPYKDCTCALGCRCTSRPVLPYS